MIPLIATNPSTAPQPFTMADDVMNTAFFALVESIGTARLAPVSPVAQAYTCQDETMTLTIEVNNFGGALMVMVSCDSPALYDAIGMLAMRVSFHLELAPRIERCMLVVHVPASYELPDRCSGKNRVALAR